MRKGRAPRKHYPSLKQRTPVKNCVVERFKKPLNVLEIPDLKKCWVYLTAKNSIKSFASNEIEEGCATPYYVMMTTMMLTARCNHGRGLELS